MAGLKEVRNRIASVGSTRQITQAMKLVSAAKLRRAQDAVTQMRPYAEKLQEILINVSASLDASENPYAVERETKRVVLVAVTAVGLVLARAIVRDVYPANQAAGIIATLVMV